MNNLQIFANSDFITTLWMGKEPGQPGGFDIQTAINDSELTLVGSFDHIPVHVDIRLPYVEDNGTVRTQIRFVQDGKESVVEYNNPAGRLLIEQSEMMSRWLRAQIKKIQ